MSKNHILSKVKADVLKKEDKKEINRSIEKYFNQIMDIT